MSEFPAWFYGPNGEARIFAASDDVPEGWRDSPAAFVEFVAAVPEAAPVVGEIIAKRGPGRPRKDAD